ncbi:uncharacterized protein LOC108669673 [Hyalella azteca]|uniref:Uncharacterized protein LOC108669673 n=1 Tax=Hyalella azteca TaxID=294128 RepID=A0A8B7NG13_HYAAZ|nr:uncharacterized protein LOC108669673 [Hyalella azteca]
MKGPSPPSTTPFHLPVNWDGPHFINLAVLDVRDGKHGFSDSGKHFTRFYRRCNKFADELKIGKGYAVLEKVAEDHRLPKFAPLSYAQHRFASSAFSQWTAVFKGYAAFCKAFDEMNPECKNYETLQYILKGFDLVVDLICFMDIFEPLKLTMEACQSLASTPWKTHKYVKQLAEFFDSMNFREKVGTPYVRKHLHEVVTENTFQGVTLIEGYLVTDEHQVEVEEDFIAGSRSRGTLQQRKKKKTVINWMSRELNDCLEDNAQLTSDLSISLKNRLVKCSHPAMVMLSECLDLSH